MLRIIFLIAFLLSGCAEPETDVTNLVTTQLTCAAHDGDEPWYVKCTSNSRSPISIRYCQGPTKKILDDNLGNYFCWGNAHAVYLILLDNAQQWNFPVGVPTPEVRWTDGKKVVPFSQWELYKFLIPTFIWK